MAMDTRLLKRIKSFYDSIEDKVYWISYQAKDTISETFPHILYGSGYEYTYATECMSISKSIMPLFLKLYRSKFRSQFFNLILFERKFCCPCLIYKDINTNINSINFNEKESSIIISYKDHKLLDSFWKKTINSYDERSIAEDFYDLLDNILEISKVLPKSELNFSNVENVKNVENIFNLIIDKTLTSHLEIKGNLHDYKFSNDQVLQLFIGSFLYPWQSFIYQDLSDILGEYNTIQGGLTICYRRRYNNLSQIKTEYKSEIYELQHIILAKIWELNLLHRQDNALKSAKAAIMSRNMSHNLGSHVMFYIKQKLQSVSKIVDNKVLANIIPGELSDLKTIEQKIKENKDVELPFLVGLGRFINYLQERQDYIATVATDYIPANSTISFKDFVYDELKPDLRYERHYSKSNDAGWKPGNLLLDYIAYSEGYRSCDDIDIFFGEFNGHNPIKGSGPDKDFQKLREFNIAVPGGVIGRQALFSIFENIIRNAAKHSERRSDNKLVLQLSLLEKDSELLKELKAKREKKKSEIDKDELKNLYSNHSDKYHFLRIKVDMPNPSGVIDTLVNSLADPYIDDNGAMKETTKGLKEMRISAAWLRGYSIDTEIPANEPPALSIYTEPYIEDNSKVTISYIVCLPKPCKVAFVVECDNSDTVNGLLTPYGCKVFTPNLLNSEDNINEIANYEIVCMSEDNRDLCSRISSRYIANQDKSAELLKELKCAITKNYEETLKQEAEQAQIEAEKNPTEENKKKAESAKENLTKVDDIKKKAINAAIGFIYEEWFNTVYNDITPKLVIADEKAFKDKEKECEKLNDGKEDKDRIILKTTSQMLQADCTDNIIYSTHFKGLGFDTTDYGQMLTASACIESITGNNSTARILRQDEWNEEWKYKLLSSGLAKVAIFDERIFSSFIMRDSASKHDMLFPTVDDIRKAKEEKQDQDFYDYLKGYEIHEDDASDIYYNLSTIEEMLARYNNKCKYNCDVAQRNHERRIYAFDIRVGEKETVNVVGYNVNIRENVGQYANHEKDAEIIIAQIMYKDKNVKVEITDMGQEIFEVGDKYSDLNKEKSSIFDYITIHQGVLDKIYTAFGIKNDEEEKYKVTNAIHRSFSKYDTPAEVDKFLPNFIIHSGRSKPSKDDMPQKQPFVQFAAIDHAVKDCKYTLVELLATAHYEK